MSEKIYYFILIDYYVCLVTIEYKLYLQIKFIDI